MTGVRPRRTILSRVRPITLVSPVHLRDASHSPHPPPHRINDRRRLDVVEVANRGQQRSVPELAGDDPDIDTFGPELCRVGVTQAVGVDPLGDPGLSAQPLHQPPHVPGRQGRAVRGAEQRVAARGPPARAPVPRPFGPCRVRRARPPRRPPRAGRGPRPDTDRPCHEAPARCRSRGPRPWAGGSAPRDAEPGPVHERDQARLRSATGVYLPQASSRARTSSSVSTSGGRRRWASAARDRHPLRPRFPRSRRSSVATRATGATGLARTRSTPSRHSIPPTRRGVPCLASSHALAPDGVTAGGGRSREHPRLRSGDQSGTGQWRCEQEEEARRSVNLLSLSHRMTLRYPMQVTMLVDSLKMVRSET